MKYHCTLELRAALTWPDRKLKGMLLNAETRAPLSPGECRDLFIEHLREGREYLPTCDAAGPDGRCQGHPSEKAVDVGGMNEEAS